MLKHISVNTAKLWYMWNIDDVCISKLEAGKLYTDVTLQKLCVYISQTTSLKT